MIKAILVDDEPSGLFTLKQLLEEYCPEVRVIAECDNATDAREKIELLDPQLVFLDISLPGKNSFELLEELDQFDFEIIFVTAHSQHTLKAFHYSAVDYLVKPIDEDLLVHAVRRAARRIEKSSVQKNVADLIQHITIPPGNRLQKLCIPSLKGFQVVEIHDIIYCEASGSYTNIHFAGLPMICSARPIQDYEALLTDAGFVRVHKSFLVNLMHIKEYIRGDGGTLVMSNNEEVEVSRRKKDLLFTQMKGFNKF
ncbi:LytTR family DNA-binding domain-containing protein [Flavihumibacter rivuli]|uniref:LytR/AlgR family response regulator transcription factor n=1 Tax=Flavihumibacter rivuli TaxID=2838156 RepID=UPI001BDF403F|nr:LytTR family DNA-binding domain-containing protein [Flavihumibacter rivuli]ULQ55893.1 LytTR family DNA-binding domain-containing protein [Flavihumibacter rivuli]